MAYFAPTAAEKCIVTAENIDFVRDSVDLVVMAKAIEVGAEVWEARDGFALRLPDGRGMLDHFDDQSGPLVGRWEAGVFTPHNADDFGMGWTYDELGEEIDAY
jgi:hypothetical protein